MRHQHSLFLRLGLTLAVLFAISAIVATWFASRATNNAMLEQSRAQLESVLKARAIAIEDQYRTMQMQVANLALNQSIVTALSAFTEGFDQLEEDAKIDGPSKEQIDNDLIKFYETEFVSRFDTNIDAESYIPEEPRHRLAQWIYIVDNPNPVGKKNEAYQPSVKTEYHRAHDRFHGQLNRFLTSFDFYDVFLFDLNARMVYSSRKETDFGTSFYYGPYAESNLGEVVRASLSSDRNEVTTSEVAPYVPSYFDPASFFAAPVYNTTGLIGVAAFQISNERINKIVSDVHGLRKTGETYIVGPDLLMRTDSRFTRDSTILKQTVDTAATRAVMQGESGFTITPDYRGVNVLSQYRPLEIEGLRWGILAEIDQAEVREPASELLLSMVKILLATISFIALVTYLLFRMGVEPPLAAITFMANNIIGGNYSARTAVIGKNEFSLVAQSQNELAESVEQHITELEAALKEVRELKMLIPMCAYCKSIRDDDGYFRTVESYLAGKSNLEFSHTYCEPCLERFFPEEVSPALPDNH